MSEEQNPAAEVKKKVDEDWKAAMRREKEKLAAKQKASAEQEEEAAGETDQMFLGFINQLVAQTMMDLGAMPHPASGQREVNLEQAKQMIEILRSLDRKTKKSQSKEEQDFFRQVLSELQMLFVQISQQAGEGAEQAGGDGGVGAPELGQGPQAEAPGPAAGTRGAVPGTGRKRRRG